MKYEHIFFDLDRTLWDYDANAFKALSMVFSEFKLHRYYSSPEEFFSVFTKYNEQLWEEYRNGTVQKIELRALRFYLTLMEKEVDDKNLSRHIGDRYMYLTPRQNNLFPSTIEILDYLTEKKYKIYILSNGFTQTQHRKMNYCKITPYFSQVFCSEELGISKPKKEFFHWAVSSIHGRKKSCLMIGDDLRVDIQGAMNYGIDAAWFNPHREESDFKPSYTINDLSELKKIL